MTGIARIIWLCVALMALVSTAYCADIFPTVDFAFNPATFEYAWTVNYTTDVNVYFTTFQVYSKLPAASWTSVSGAWSGSPSTDEAWTFTPMTNADGTNALRWTGGSAHQRIPGTGAWTGTFKVTVPNSEPIAGNVRTFASAIKYQIQASSVPNVVPEPSSFLALGSLVGLIPLVLKKRK